MDKWNEPQPDFAVFQPRAACYGARHPGLPDVLLLVEVSDTSFRYDSAVKLPIYARASIAELWIVDVRHRALHTYQSPLDGRFTRFT